MACGLSRLRFRNCLTQIAQRGVVVVDVYGSLDRVKRVGASVECQVSDGHEPIERGILRAEGCRALPVSQRELGLVELEKVNSRLLLHVEVLRTGLCHVCDCAGKLLGAAEHRQCMPTARCARAAQLPSWKICSTAERCLPPG